MTKHASTLGRETYLGIFRLLHWEVPHVPKILVMGPIKWLLLKRNFKKNLGAPCHLFIEAWISTPSLNPVSAFHTQ
jgi:hypothetical protein